MSDPPRTFDELCQDVAWPLSRLYHQHSKLSGHKLLEFQERIATFSQDAEAVRESSRAYKLYPTRPSITLPRAKRRLGGRRLIDILLSRRTRRGTFSHRAVTLKQWGRLLEAACGLTGHVTHPDFPDVTQDLRAWPSGGAMYPIETYLFALQGGELERGLYHYQVESHSLAHLGPCPEEEQLHRLVYADGLWENAGGLIVLTAVFERTQTKYGERGYRFVFLDAGHLAQSILLVSEDLRLAAIPLGGFDDDGLAAEMGVEPLTENPIYAILIGTE